MFKKRPLIPIFTYLFLAVATLVFFVWFNHVRGVKEYAYVSFFSNRQYSIDIEGIKQEDDSKCGVASVQMILKYYGIEATQDEIAILANHTYDYGCDDVGMKDALEHYGLNVSIIDSSSYRQIDSLLNKKIPVIVDWMAALDGYQAYGHSSIVVHLDKEYVYLLDPWIGRVRKLERLEFETVWFDWKETDFISCENIVYKQIIVATK